MMLSQTAEYALRAVLYLAGPAKGRQVSVEDIVAAIGMPSSYAAKVLQTLTRTGILKAARGRNGGYTLDMDPGEMSLAMVVAPFEEAREQRRCLLGRTHCSDATPCAAHHRWKDTAEDITRFFRTTSIADLKSPVGQLVQG